jgi:hypothetical protein
LADSSGFIVQTFTDVAMLLMMQPAAFKFQKIYDQLNFWFIEQNSKLRKFNDDECEDIM